MKKALTLALILISIGVNAQYSKKYNYNDNYMWKTPQLYIPTATLLSTFVINEFNNNLSPKQKDIVAITGILTSVSIYLVLNYKTIKKK